ncbi:hypothetical protein I4F81_003235 [Pyropia yezoensis]|uniref:Uncharacterized protein n=1 Tax=Pyropia yezoensis TaxID=2788 RepID=A0ACC3BS25_PYRYE|nr:hypothetical protein I4F81_003235 [Neopyropia yezoensis]
MSAGSTVSSVTSAISNSSVRAAPDISSLANLVKTFRASVTVKDRTYRLRRYKSCFTGVDAVRTLIAIGAAQTIEEALIVGNNLIADQIIEHGLLSWPS